MFHVSYFLRSFMVSFKDGLILFIKIFFNWKCFISTTVIFRFNIILTPRITHSDWFMIIFLYMLKKTNCFIFFFQSKKISYIFKCDVIYVFFQSKKNFYIFNYLVFYFLNLFKSYTFYHYMLWKKLTNYYLKKDYYSTWKHYLYGNWMILSDSEIL